MYIIFKKIFILLILIFTGMASYSFNLNEIKAGKVNGLVLDSKLNVPIEYANIAVYKVSDSSFVSGTITNSLGRFIISDLPNDSYYLVAQFVGYKKKILGDLSLTDKNKLIALPDIKLEENVFELEEVTIRSEMNPIEQKIDKKVINVTKDINSVGGTAVDILQYNAIVKTNTEGEIMLRNSTNFLVLVDGRQSPFRGTEALQMIPANTVEKIEVITNPSAKYNAEGVAGIINILVKKQKTIGLSGIINASYSSNESNSGDFLFNLKKEKMNFYIGADGRKNINNQYFDIKRRYQLDDISYSNDEIVDQTGIRPSSNLRMGFDYNFDNSTSISLINIVGTSDFHKNKAVYNKQWTATDQQPIYFANNETYEVDGYFINPAMLLTHKFSEKGNVITADFSYTYLNSGFDQLSKDFATDNQYRQTDFEPEMLKSTNNYERFLYELKSDYLLNINDKTKFESGVLISGNKRSVALDFKNFNYTTNNWDVNGQFSNSLVFNEKIYAAYLMFSGEIQKTKYQLGLRSEITDRVLEQHTGDENYSYKKLHLFPTIHLSKQVTEKFQIQASYSRRIQRPTDAWLNPYPSSLSSKLMNVGNPNLIPDITDSYELNFSKLFGQITLSVNNYYRYTKNAITQLTYLDDRGGHVMTYGNMELNRFAGSEISAGINNLKKIKINPSVDIYYMESRGVIDGYEANYDALSFSMRLNSSIDIFKTTRLQLNAIYNGKAVTQQGNLDPYYVLTVSVRQELLQKNLVLVLQSRNLFNSGNIKVDENGKNFVNRFCYFPEKNIITFNVSYKIKNFKRNNRLQQNRINESF